MLDQIPSPDIPVSFGSKGPDKGIPASELYLKLTESRPSVVVPYPRDGEDGKPVGEVRIQVLTEKEHKLSRSTAFNRIKNDWDPQSWNTDVFKVALGDETAKEMLAKAVVSTKAVPDPMEGKPGYSPVYQRLYRDAKDISDLPSSEVEALFNTYLVVQHRFGPWDRVARTQDDLEAWIRRLGEGGNEFPLLSKDLPRLVELTSLLAALVYTSSVILDRHSKDLPATFVSDLRKYCSAMFCYGRQPLESTQNSGTEKSAVDAVIEEAGIKPKELIDLADAKAIAEQMREMK